MQTKQTKPAKPKAAVTGNNVRRRNGRWEALLLVFTPTGCEVHRAEAAVSASKSVGPSSPVAVYLNELGGEVRYSGDDRAAVVDAHRGGRDLAKVRLKAQGYRVGGSCA